MSRSYKYTPVIKDGSRRGGKKCAKRQAVLLPLETGGVGHEKRVGEMVL